MSIYWNYHKGIYSSPSLKQTFWKHSKKCILKAISKWEIWSFNNCNSRNEFALSINISKKQKISLELVTKAKNLKFIQKCFNPDPKLSLICDYGHRHAWKTAASPLLQRVECIWLCIIYVPLYKLSWAQILISN